MWSSQGDGEVEAHEILGLLQYVLTCGVYGRPTLESEDASTKAASFLLSEETAHEWFLQFELAARFKPCKVWPSLRRRACACLVVRMCAL